MDVSNYVTYEGRLECATDATASATLDLPNLDVVKDNVIKQDSFVLNGKSTNESNWILMALDPLKPVLFIDTSMVTELIEIEYFVCINEKCSEKPSFVISLVNILSPRTKLKFAQSPFSLNDINSLFPRIGCSCLECAPVKNNT